MMTNRKIPQCYETLISMGVLDLKETVCTDDGFWLTAVSLENILARREILSLPDADGELMECRLYFDDWYLYAVSSGTDSVYGLLKLREQETDRQNGLKADGDTPGVTVSFVGFHTSLLENCLADRSTDNRKALCTEINRVVSYRGEYHDPILKAYFVKPEAKGPYLIARRYACHIASFAEEGKLLLPEAYRKRYHAGVKKNRIVRFLEKNNGRANRTICDHSMLYITDPIHLSREEMYAVFATHTANTSFHSFAAEIRFHALFLVSWIKWIPVMGKAIYESAVRADLTIDNGVLAELAPYYCESSFLVQNQSRHNPEFD